MCAHDSNLYSNNECKQCDRDRNDRYRRRRRLGMALLHAAEERGLSGGEALALLKNADYRTLQACQSANRELADA